MKKVGSLQWQLEEEIKLIIKEIFKVSPSGGDLEWAYERKQKYKSYFPL